METKDIVKAAPTALFMIRPYPELAVVTRINSGDDLQELIRNSLGGEPDRRASPTEEEQEFGIIDVYTKGNLVLHVHSGLNAYEELSFTVAQMAQEIEIQTLLNEKGISARVIRICICGQCGKEGTEEQREPKADDTSDN